MKKNFLLWMGVVLMTLHGMMACTVDDVPVDNSVNIESLYGEWWLVGWNDGGTWFEVDTNYVSHRHMSLEFRKVDKEVYIYAWSMVNEIYFGKLLSIDGNELVMDRKSAGTTKVLGSLKENLFFEDHIRYIKSCQMNYQYWRW